MKENQLTLNADKNRFPRFPTRNKLEPKVSFNGNVMKSAESCRYLEIHFDRKLSFEVHLNIVLTEMAAAIFSL